MFRSDEYGDTADDTARTEGEGAGATAEAPSRTSFEAMLRDELGTLPPLASQTGMAADKAA